MGLDPKLVMSLAYTFATGADLRVADVAAHRRGLEHAPEPCRKTVKTDGGVEPGERNALRRSVRERGIAGSC